MREVKQRRGGCLSRRRAAPARAALATELATEQGNAGMSTREEGAASPLVGSKQDLIDWIAAGCKPRERWRIGTEHEKFVFNTADLTAVPYAGPRGIRALIAVFGFFGGFIIIPAIDEPHHIGVLFNRT